MPTEDAAAGSDPATGDRDRRRVVTRRRALAGLAAAGAVALAGCSSVVQSDLVPDLDEPSPNWRTGIDGASASGPPAVVDDLLLVGAQDRALHGFGTEDGDPAFAHETGGPIEARPAVPGTGGPFHVHSTDGDIYAVDRSGERRWHEEGVDARGRIARAGSLLVELAGEERDIARGLDAGSGAVRFERPVETFRLDGLTPDLFTVPTPADGERTRLAGLSPADGGVHWETDPTEAYPNVAADRDLVVAAGGGTLTARDPGDGSVRWETAVAGAGGFQPLVLGSQVYLTGRDAEYGIVALDRETGDRRWEALREPDVRWVAPAPNAAFVGSRVPDPDDGGIVGRVDCFELDGTRRWSTLTGAPDPERLLVAGELVVAAADRSLAGIERATGEVRWRHEPESRVSATADDTAVYVSYVDEGAVAELPTRE